MECTDWSDVIDHVITAVIILGAFGMLAVMTIKGIK